MVDFRSGGHFEFSSEKNWGKEQYDCKIFDSIDITHLADSIASIPFNLRHNIPAEIFTVEQLEEFEVEASLALSRHTFQSNTKLRNKNIFSTSIECNQIQETDKFMKLILNDFPKSENINVLEHETDSNEQLNLILGNMKPIITTLQDEISTVNTIDNDKTNSIIVGKQNNSIKTDSEVETTHDQGHWLDSILDSDE